MTPKRPAPSMHAIVTGFFEPDVNDQAYNIEPNFAATTLALVGRDECCQGYNESEGSLQRSAYYLQFLSFFGLDAEGGLECMDYFDAFSWQGTAGNIEVYYAANWNGS